MAEITTIARPYAEAAFDLAQKDDALSRWSETLRFLGALVTDPKVADALDNPRLAEAEKESLLLSLIGDRVNELERNYVRVLVASDRVEMLPEIARLFESLKGDAEGVAKAVIQTAFPLDEAQVRDLTTALERRFGRRIEATVDVDRALIGGVRIAVGDTVIDGSVRARLEAMHVHLRA